MSLTVEQKNNIKSSIEEIEKNSNVSFEDYVFSRKWWYETFSQRAFYFDECDDFLDFMFRDVSLFYGKGLHIVVDGSLTKNSKNLINRDYKETIARQISYTLCVKHIKNNIMFNFSNCLRRIEFPILMQSILDFSKSADLQEDLLSYEILIISNISLDFVKTKSIDKKNESDRMSTYDSMRKERMELFFNGLLMERMNNGKITIFTIQGDYGDLVNDACYLGSCFDYLIATLQCKSNKFKGDIIEKGKCCRVSLLNNKNSSTKINLESQLQASIIQCLSFLQIDYDDDIFSILKNECEKYKIEYYVFLKNLRSDIENAKRFGEEGKISIKKIMKSMKNAPSVFIMLRSFENE